VLIFFYLYFCPFSVQRDVQKPDTQLGLKDKDILLYLEAITRIEDDALFLPPAVTRESIVQDTLKTYLEEKDLFSDYLTHEEYSRLKEFQADKYVGIGMEIEKDQDGGFICFPYSGSPAEKAGIKFGDRLRSINGISVHGKSIFTVASMARGERGTKITLEIVTKDRTDKQVSVIRSNVTIDNVSKHWFDKIMVIKILAFTRDTKEELKQTLNDWKKNDPIVIDLRGNSGGDLYAAIDSAMLLLEKGKKVVSIKTRNGSKIFESNNSTINLISPVYLWQDEATASAAEVFIAALTDNNRAVSIGKKTFGKGTKQDIIELSDGSALVLTTGYLQTPKGIEYQGHGLDPTYMLEGNTSETAGYLAKVEELISSRSKVFPEGILNK
jgi:carboxyl-terminal processing protease